MTRLLILTPALAVAAILLGGPAIAGSFEATA